MILGLNKTIIDEAGTGATTEFHHVDNFSIDTKTNSAYIHVGSYISKSTFDASKNPIMTTSIPVLGLTEYSTDAIYTAIIALEDSIFYEATKVE